jgi:hypothetical protein
MFPISRLLMFLALVCTAAAAVAAPPLPPVHHVIVLVLENQSFEATFGRPSARSYLTHTLPSKGVLLRNYYAIGHYSLPNYIAMISGQGPNDATQMDCPQFSELNASTDSLDRDGQLPGVGCVYPASVGTLASQLQAAGLRWRAYMEDMGNDLQRERATCAHPDVGGVDRTEQAQATDQYATRHDPFVYFHGVIDDAARCNDTVVNLNELPHDLERIETTPNFIFITPNLCNDGHDKPCVDGKTGGLDAIDGFLREWMPRIEKAPAFRADGMLVVTFDESGTVNPDGSTACCGERGLPGMTNPPGLAGPGGGRVGAVVISRFVRPGSVSVVPYNHYALLKSVETIFGLPALGYAGAPGLRIFGPDVFKAR